MIQSTMLILPDEIGKYIQDFIRPIQKPTDINKLLKYYENIEKKLGSIIRYKIGMNFLTINSKGYPKLNTITHNSSMIITQEKTIGRYGITYERKMHRKAPSLYGKLELNFKYLTYKPIHIKRYLKTKEMIKRLNNLNLILLLDKSYLESFILRDSQCFWLKI